MQGDCSASTSLPVAQSGPALQPAARRSQCYILTQGDLFRLDTSGQKLVMDNLYLRADRGGEEAAAAPDGVPTLVDVRAPAAELWLSATTLQSDGRAGRALDITDAAAAAYIADVQVRAVRAVINCPHRRAALFRPYSRFLIHVCASLYQLPCRR